MLSTVKEVPIQIKQEPVERDLQPEPEKTKSRYKKSAPQAPVSVVSALLQHLFDSSIFMMYLGNVLLSKVLQHWCPIFYSLFLFLNPLLHLICLYSRSTCMCVWYVGVVVMRIGCCYAMAVMTATILSAWFHPFMMSLRVTGGAPSVWHRCGKRGPICHTLISHSNQNNACLTLASWSLYQYRAKLPMTNYLWPAVY